MFQSGQSQQDYDQWLVHWHILRCEVSPSLSIMIWMGEVFILVRLLRRTPPYLVLPNLGRGTDTVSMGIAELTTLTVLVADSTKLAGWLTTCCLACTLFHCWARGVRALSMLVDKMRAPLQLGWSPSLLSRPGLVLFVGESQKEGQLSKCLSFGRAENSLTSDWVVWVYFLFLQGQCTLINVSVKVPVLASRLIFNRSPWAGY